MRRLTNREVMAPGERLEIRSAPDCPQRDAMLATVKVWSGDSRRRRRRTATANLDCGCARRHGSSAGRDEETSQVEQRNWLGSWISWPLNNTKTKRRRQLDKLKSY
jgi:hypothetical protein